MKEINREHFEYWLFSQPLEREFELESASDCALCAFLKEIEHAPKPYVLHHTLVTNGDCLTSMIGNPKAIPIPEWMDKHSHKVTGDELLRVKPLTIANMRRRYLELFPDIITHLDTPAPSNAREGVERV